jgi:hypothetical protein
MTNMNNKTRRGRHPVNLESRKNGGVLNSKAELTSEKELSEAGEAVDVVDTSVMDAAVAANKARTDATKAEAMKIQQECGISQETLAHFRVDRTRGGWAFPTFSEWPSRGQFRVIHGDSLRRRSVWARQIGLKRPIAYNLDEVKQNLKDLSTNTRISEVNLGQRSVSTLTPYQEGRLQRQRRKAEDARSPWRGAGGTWRDQQRNESEAARRAESPQTDIWVVEWEPEVWCLYQNDYVAVSPFVAASPFNEGKALNNGHRYEALADALQTMLYDTRFLTASTYFDGPSDDLQGASALEEALWRKGKPIIRIFVGGDVSGRIRAVALRRAFQTRGILYQAHCVGGTRPMGILDLFAACRFDKSEFQCAIRKLPRVSEAEIDQWVTYHVPSFIDEEVEHEDIEP